LSRPGNKTLLIRQKGKAAWQT